MKECVVTKSRVVNRLFKNYWISHRTIDKRCADCGINQHLLESCHNLVIFCHGHNDVYFKPVWTQKHWSLARIVIPVSAQRKWMDIASIEPHTNYNYKHKIYFASERNQSAVTDVLASANNGVCNFSCTCIALKMSRQGVSLYMFSRGIGITDKTRINAYDTSTNQV